jgi:hypothetical protein
VTRCALADSQGGNGRLTELTPVFIAGWGVGD